MFSSFSKQTLDIEYHVNIWQVSPQPSCGDTIWFKESKSYFWKIENFAHGEIYQQSISKPYPWSTKKSNLKSMMRNKDSKRGIWKFGSQLKTTLENPY